jgi:hypothetical protein
MSESIHPSQAPEPSAEPGSSPTGRDASAIETELIGTLGPMPTWLKLIVVALGAIVVAGLAAWIHQLRLGCR